MTETNERLKEARKAARISQNELADLAGISQVTVQQIESGRNKNSKMLAPIAIALGVSMDWLATGRGSPAVSDKPQGYTADAFAKTTFLLARQYLR